MLNLGDLVNRRSAQLTHALRDAVHAVDVGLAELTAMGVDRQPPADLDRAVGDVVLRLTPSDIDVAVLYDHFTPFVLIQLEELGFCKRGEARDFIADGALELDGQLPLNPNGGQLGEAYIHGMNGIAEAVRQVRGTAVNQVHSARSVLVTAGTGVPTSGLVLTAA